MHRVLSLAAVAASALAAGPSIARAGELRVRAEIAAEVDSNVNHAERPDADDGDTVAPRGAALIRVGGRLDGGGGLAGGRWGTQLAVDGRAEAQGDAPGENVAVLAAQARWARPLSGRPVRTGARVAAYDAVGNGDVGARTFRWLLAEGLLGVDDGERHALLAAGYHDFVYGPAPALDWRGPSLGVDLGAQLWRGHAAAPTAPTTAPADAADDASSLELAARYRLEARDYAGFALAPGCPSASDGPCVQTIGERRADLVHRLAAGVTYTGDRVYAAEYELTVVDSTSLGQSLVRHRATAAATVALPAGLLASARLALQLDQYLDGLLVPVAGDVQSLTSIDEENRSSLSLHLARPLGAVTVEARWAYWTSLGSSGADFSRHLVSVGLVWGSGT